MLEAGGWGPGAPRCSPPEATRERSVLWACRMDWRARSSTPRATNDWQLSPIVAYEWHNIHEII